MSAIDEIMAERARQIAKGYDAAHDDRHTDGSIARAAGAYALHGKTVLALMGPPSRPLLTRQADPKYWWPWSEEAYQPGTDRERLIKAAALIVAEIERLDRSAPPSTQPSSDDCDCIGAVIGQHDRSCPHSRHDRGGAA